MTNFWNRTIHRMIPRHGAGLFGIGAAFSASLYLSVLVTEIVSLTYISSTNASFTSKIIDFINMPSTENITAIIIFSFIWIFLGAIACAGGSRYLIGCVDPKHIAQRTFFNGIKYYSIKMITYTAFLVAGGLISLVLLWFIVSLSSGFTGSIAATYSVLSIIAYLIVISLFWSKLSYIPYFILANNGLFTSIAKSWTATKRRFWAIWVLRVLMVIFVTIPVLIKYIASPASQVPSLSVWPFVALITFGYVELIVVRGYQEWQEKKNLPVVAGKFADKDMKQLDIYNNQSGPSSMEF